MTIKSLVRIDDCEINVCWSNETQLLDLLSLQKPSESLDFCTELVQQKINFFIEKKVFVKDSFPTVIDIGSGIGMEDLFLQPYTKGTFYLLDKDEITNQPYNAFNLNYSFYNNKTCTIDAIKTSGLDINSFKFLTPDDVWPVTFDIIMSNSSWCWHYPFEVYWKKVKSSLKPNGKLYLDISNRALEHSPTMIHEISESLQSSPDVFLYKKHNAKDRRNLLWKNGYFGIGALWSKK